MDVPFLAFAFRKRPIAGPSRSRPRANDVRPVEAFTGHEISALPGPPSAWRGQGAYAPEPSRATLRAAARALPTARPRLLEYLGVIGLIVLIVVLAGVVW